MSYTEVDSAKVRELAKQTITGILAARERAVKQIVKRDIESHKHSWAVRFFGRAVMTYDEALEARMSSQSLIDGNLDLLFAESKYSWQYKAAQKLLKLCDLAESTAGNGKVLVDEEDAYAISP